MQRKSSAAINRTGRKVVLGPWEKKRLTQLMLCVGLFLVVLLGKGVAPAGMRQSGENLLKLIGADTDFAAAFSVLGQAISDGEGVIPTLGKLSVEVFDVQQPQEEPEEDAFWLDGRSGQAVLEALRMPVTPEVMLSRLGVTVPQEVPIQQEQLFLEPKSDPEPSPEPASAPSIPNYTGPALPAGASMEYYDLGLAQIVTPVLGEVSSAYGYRDHPVNGGYTFHNGVDLSADSGTPIAAFAAGKVDFIGESAAYGLYIQLDHGNGITTFYCHCSKLHAQKGETVSAGQTIAAVGATGNVTGSHLHLELERNGVLLNPLYYIETL